jgi:hypothetical protein
MKTKRGAFDIMQKKRTGVDTPGRKGTTGISNMFDESEMSDIESLDFSSQGMPMTSGRGR